MVSEQEVEVERQGGDEVYDVNRCPNERQLAGTDDEPNEYFERKPGIADAFNVEEGIVRVCASLVEHPRRRKASVRPDSSGI